MKPIIAVAALVATLPLGPAAAQYSYCSQPSAPTAYLRKPDKPFCAASRSCEDYKVSAYRNDVETYFRKLKRYAEEVDTFHSEASDYVECNTAALGLHRYAERVVHRPNDVSASAHLPQRRLQLRIDLPPAVALLVC